jgi:adenylosuccinate lyase
MNTALEALSPLDGRYSKTTAPLTAYFSEAALIRYRIRVEVEYLLALSHVGLPGLDPIAGPPAEGLRQLYLQFDLALAERVKAIEAVTNHDVKAIEYLLKEEADRLGLGYCKEFIHFGLTSQDINNTAVPLSIKESLDELILPAIADLADALDRLASEWADLPMLARTHGQPASPTRLGKEIAVFAERLRQQLKLLKSIPHAAKFGGATGNLNAHFVAYPEVEWHGFAKLFVEETLGLHRSFPTTQIEHYDHLAALFDGLKRIATILVDLDRDLWAYISMDYFKQRIKEGEVGSSAMPHKVNPIDFENSEGNLGLAIALFEFLAAKLPVSRLQRDLTDSTVLRNVGVPMGHLLIGIRSLNRGLGKLLLNEAKILSDLEDNWAVVAEAIQTVLRTTGYPNPYEKLKELTRTNAGINEQSIREFVEGLDVSEAVKARLRSITPMTYTGR